VGHGVTETVARRLIVLLVAAVVAYAAWLVAGPHHAIAPRDTWLSGTTLVLASGVTILRGLRGRGSLPWLVMAVGMSLWSIGDAIFSFSAQSSRTTFTVADAFYLAFYPCMYLGLVLFLRQHVERFPLSVALDGVLIAFGVAAFGTLEIRAVVTPGSGLVGTVVDALFPAGDLLLLILILGLLMLLGRSGGRPWGCLATGCALFALADAAYLLQGDSYRIGTVLDAGWPAALTLLAISGWLTDDTTPVPVSEPALLVLPSVIALASIGFLVASSRASLPLAGVVLAACALVAVLLRGALSFYEVSALAESRRQALTDDLTGLGNRRRLRQQLERYLVDPACQSFALLLLDLDRFKEVNDALGHGVGDELLCQLGTLLSKRLRSVDLVARLGGDEFALLLDSGTGTTAAVTAAKRTLEALTWPFTVSDMSLHVDASIGIALYPEHGDTHSDLLRCADIAMYRAKRARTGYAVYSAESDVYSRDRLLTIEQLREAIAADQLTCHYQPEVDLRTGRVVAAEALVRWEHPTRGLLLPDEFLPLAEQTGLMHEVFTYVLDDALAQCRLWRGDGHDIRVAVNLSVTNLLDVTLRDDVSDLLHRHELSPAALVLEVTEDVLLADPDSARTVLDDLRGLGTRASLDDYGTGYNSLAILQTLPLDELKLDRTFVTGIAAKPKAAAIVQATVALARSLGLDLVAEGVESEADSEELARLGVGLAQGFWISGPQPAVELARWLDAHRAGKSEPASGPHPASLTRGAAPRRTA
jgi:diguanylate cyclase (GGDEF)-like protein